MAVELLDWPPDGPPPGLEAAVDFVNTTGLTRGRPFEDFPTAEAVVDWLAANGYFPPEGADSEHGRFEEAPELDAAALRRGPAPSGGVRGPVRAPARVPWPPPPAGAALPSPPRP